MAQYDGSIRINTEILVKSAEKQLKALENNMEKTATKAASWRTEMEALRNTKIPTQDYKDISKEIEKAEQNLSKLTDKQSQMQREGKASGAAWERLKLQIRSTEEVIEDAKSDMQNLVDTGKAFTLGSSTEKYSELGRKIKEADDSLEVMNQQHKILEDRLNVAIQKRDVEKAKIEELSAEEQRLLEIKANATVSDQELIKLLERRKELLIEIAELERAGVTQGYQENDVARQELASVNSRINTIQQERASTEEIRASYVRLGDAVRSAFRTIGKGLIDIPVAAVKKGVQGLLTVFSKLGNVVKKSAIAPFKLMGNVAKNAFSKINQHASRSGGFLSKFGGQIKNMVASFLIFNQIRKIFSSTIKAIKEGFSNLYEENARFKSSVDNLKASVLTLKNALATAFAPIVETAIPYIQRLVEWLTKAADAAGQLIAALMGKKTYTKAIKQSAKASDDAAKVTKKEAEAIEEAEEAAEGYLSPLDEINKYREEEVKNSKKTTPEEIEESPAEQIGNMFEEVPISDKFKDIAQWLKDMWEKADFAELGALLGQKLKDALDNIPWEEIKEIASKIGKSIATFVNGFVEVEGLGESIGRTLAEAINTGFEFLNAFVHNLHWESIGKFIAETINGFFTNIDWNLIYDTFITGAKGLGDAINSFADNLDWEAFSASVSNFVNTFVDTVNTFFDTVDWLEIGRKIGKFLSDAIAEIDWKNLGKMLTTKIRVIMELIVGAIQSMDMAEVAKGLSDIAIGFFDSLSEAVESIDWWEIGEKVKEFLVNIDWAGVAESLFEALGAALGGLSAFLGGLIADGVEAAGQYFQDKIEECGGNVVLGILKGIGDALIGIGEWIYEHILTPFLEGFKAAFGIHSPSTVMQEMGIYIIQGLLNGLQEMWTSVIDWWNNTALSGWWNDNVAPWFTAEKWLELFQNIQVALSEMWNSLVEWWSNTAIVGWWEEHVSPWFTSEKWMELFDNIKTSLKEVWDNTVNQWVSDVTAWWEEHVAPWFTKEKWEEILNSVPEAFSSAFTKVVDTVKEKIQSAVDWVVEKVDWLKEKVSSIKDTFSGITSKIGGFFSGGFGRSTFSTNSYSTSSYMLRSPEIAKLANVEIPGYATGQVIPRTMKQHLAWLGDNNRETEVVSPLSTIKQAQRESLLEVLSELGLAESKGNGNNQTIIIKQYLDGKQVAESVVKEGKVQQMATGSNMFMLGTT